jgi:hypothetical protein
MKESDLLRFYANPMKLLLLILGSGMFVAIGVWMLRTPGVTDHSSNVVRAWLVIGVFGPGVIVFLILILRDVIFRQPVLQIDGQGWSCRTRFFVKQQTIHWQDIERVGMYCQDLGQRRKMFYLVIHGNNPNSVAHVTTPRFVTRFYPVLQGALLTLPLNNLFVRATPQKVERVLERICTRYAYELQLYRIDVDTTMQAL